MDIKKERINISRKKIRIPLKSIENSQIVKCHIFLIKQLFLLFAVNKVIIMVEYLKKEKVW